LALQSKAARPPISEVSRSFTHTWHYSACGTGYYLHDTKQTQKTNNHGLNRIQTSNSSKPAVADLSLRLRGLIVHFCEHSYNQCHWLTDISCYVTVMDRRKKKKVIQTNTGKLWLQLWQQLWFATWKF